MSRVGGPIYDPTSVAAGVAGSTHVFTRWRGVGGVGLHPLQRAGVVDSDSHDIVAAQAAPHMHDGLGGARYAAGVADMTLPPVVQLVGSVRDPDFRV